MTHQNQPLHDPSTNRACLYGDGLFETIAFRGGCLQHWADHWSRLTDGLVRLAYPELTEASVLARITQHLTDTQQPHQDNQIIRLTISRSGMRGYRIPDNANLLIDVQTFPFPQYRWHGKGISARWCHTQWAKQPLLAGIKHLNRLEQVIARSEWQDNRIEEGLVCDTDGYVISGTMSGLVWQTGKTIFAPSLSHTGIASTTRKRLLTRCATLGYTIQTGYFSPESVMQADTILIMNAIQGIAFIAELDDKQFKLSPEILTLMS